MDFLYAARADRPAPEFRDALRILAAPRRAPKLGCYRCGRPGCTVDHLAEAFAK